MKHTGTIAALLTSCFLLSSCGVDKSIQPVPIPEDKMVCEALGLNDRPKIPRWEELDWTKITTLDEARERHEVFVATVLKRESIISGYITRVEGRTFLCSTNMGWIRRTRRAIAD